MPDSEIDILIKDVASCTKILLQGDKASSQESELLSQNQNIQPPQLSISSTVCNLGLRLEIASRTEIKNNPDLIFQAETLINALNTEMKKNGEIHGIPDAAKLLDLPQKLKSLKSIASVVAEKAQHKEFDQDFFDGVQTLGEGVKEIGNYFTYILAPTILFANLL